MSAFTIGDDAPRHEAVVHSAPPHSEAPAPQKPNARPRGGAREASRSEPEMHTEPHTNCAVTDRDEEGTEEEPDDEQESSLRGWLDGFSAPDIWWDRAPSLADKWAYATRGGWTGEDGVLRSVGRIYCVVVALPAAALARTVAWSTDRPGRFIAVIVLLSCLSQLPPLSWLLF